MYEKCGIALGSISVVTTEIETVSLFNYKIWSGAHYHIAVSDLYQTVGFIAGAACIYLTAHNIYHLVKKRRELKRITQQHDD